MLILMHVGCNSLQFFFCTYQLPKEIPRKVVGTFKSNVSMQLGLVKDLHLVLHLTTRTNELLTSHLHAKSKMTAERIRWIFWPVSTRTTLAAAKQTRQTLKFFCVRDCRFLTNSAPYLARLNISIQSSSDEVITAARQYPSWLWHTSDFAPIFDSPSIESSLLPPEHKMPFPDQLLYFWVEAALDPFQPASPPPPTSSSAHKCVKPLLALLSLALVSNGQILRTALFGRLFHTVEKTCRHVTPT